ncbi:SAV_915 family protein [Microbacterium sp. UFMG61]|jgi:hypothetical protein|uniref:SAV_915 family protein n=1 Tax=Microbacterium sp. UFMG61 TaxID=2745935 RepID=UPI00188E543D|nr:SAV_915 family protein [Microbacterium sp. UFMG61]
MEIVSERNVPPVVYVPVESRDDEGRTGIALMRLRTGQLAVSAYSALDRLQKVWGVGQQWMLVRTPELEAQAAEMNITRILMDPDPRPQRGGW